MLQVLVYPCTIAHPNIVRIPILELAPPEFANLRTQVAKSDQSPNSDVEG